MGFSPESFTFMTSCSLLIFHQISSFQTRSIKADNGKNLIILKPDLYEKKKNKNFKKNIKLAKFDSNLKKIEEKY